MGCTVSEPGQAQAPGNSVATSCVAKGLNSETVYYFVVNASNEYSGSANSPEKEAVIRSKLYCTQFRGWKVGPESLPSRFQLFRLYAKRGKSWETKMLVNRILSGLL